jgi:hypothetical protein
MNIEDLMQEVSAAALQAGMELTETECLSPRSGAFSPIPATS